MECDGFQAVILYWSLDNSSCNPFPQALYDSCGFSASLLIKTNEDKLCFPVLYSYLIWYTVDYTAFR